MEMGHATRPEARTDEACLDLASDILHGADQIAKFLYGDERQRRKVYHLADKENLPVFRLGTTICARKSTLLRWIEEQEQAARP